MRNNPLDNYTTYLGETVERLEGSRVLNPKLVCADLELLFEYGEA